MFKRFIIFLCILFLLIGFIVPSVLSEKPEKGEDFTHSVLLELFVTTWCQYCPDAEEKAVELNMEYGPNFHFVSMVIDENDKANQRGDDYGVVSVPTAEFDGGYREDRTGDPESYDGHIQDCGNRLVASIDLTVYQELDDDGNLRIGYSATYNDVVPPVFRGHIRVYITERESRYINDRNESIPYGFLDYAFDKDIQLPTGVEMSESTTWDIASWDADPENIVVIGAIFEDGTRYSVQTASTEDAVNIQISDVAHTPEKPERSDVITVQATVTGDYQHVVLEYAPCTEDTCKTTETVEMKEIGENRFEAEMGPFSSDIVSVHYRIMANDSQGNEVRSPLVEILFDEGGGGGDNESSSFFISKEVGFGVLVLAVIGAHLGIRLNKKRKAQSTLTNTVSHETNSEMDYKD